MCQDGPVHDLTLIGHAADFQAPRDDAPDWEHLMLQRQLDCRVVMLDRLGESRIGRALRNRHVDPERLWRLGGTLARAPAILAQSEQSGYEAALALALRRSRRPLHIIFHGHRWWTRRNRALGRIAACFGHVRFLCLARSLASILTDEYGVRPDRVTVTGYGVDRHFFRPHPGEGPPCIVSAGIASRDYGTLAAASRGIGTDVQVAADSTWYREALNVDRAEVPDNMKIFSSGGYPALRQLYARALFVVVPLLDVRYACGYAVIAEAMAMGKPVVVTRTQAPSDLVEDGVTGLYVPPADPAALAAAMTALLDDPARTRAMGQAARAAVDARLGLDHYVARLRAAMRLDGR